MLNAFASRTTTKLSKEGYSEGGSILLMSSMV